MYYVSNVKSVLFFSLGNLHFCSIVQGWGLGRNAGTYREVKRRGNFYSQAGAQVKEVGEKERKQTKNQEQQNNNKTPQISYTVVTPQATSKTFTPNNHPPHPPPPPRPAPQSCPVLHLSIYTKILFQKCGPLSAGLRRFVSLKVLLCLYSRSNCLL